MEFLFTGQWAHTEAILVFLCIAIFVLIFLYDGFLFLRRLFHVFFPKYFSKSQDTQTPELQEDINELPDTPSKEETILESTETTIEASLIPWTVSETITSSPESDNSLINAENLTEWEMGVHIEDEWTRQDIQEDETWEKIENEETIASVESESPATIDTNPLTKDTQTAEAPLENVETENISSPEMSEPVPVVENETTLEESVAPIEEEKNETIESPIIEKEEPKEIQDALSPALEIPLYWVDSWITSTPPVAPNHTETLFTLIHTIKTLIARWQTVDARWMIIQGLSLDKQNRELNIMLAWLYEQDRHFEKAEFIYKDLALIHPDNTEILEKLGNVLIIQKRYEIAMELYKKIIVLDGETEGALYILVHLSHELKMVDETYLYGKKYLKRWPNTPEILTLLWQAEVSLGKRQDAIQTLIKLKNLTPYNHEISEMIQKLVMEEELAGNFGEEK
jgi:Tfp pilus assembly protein PilF